MLTVNYSEILRATAALAGMGPADIGGAEFTLLRQFHDRRLQQAWEIHEWPDLCRVEQRAFRPLWNEDTTYAKGDERYYAPTGKYYRSLQDGNIGIAPDSDGSRVLTPMTVDANYAAMGMATATVLGTVLGRTYHWVPGANDVSISNANGDTLSAEGDIVAAGSQYLILLGSGNGVAVTATVSEVSNSEPGSDWWAEASDLDRYVAPEQLEDDGTAHTVIGDFLRAYDKNPYLTTKLVTLPFTLSHNGAQFTSLRHALGQVWIHFRLRRPVLVGDPYVSGKSYAQGEQCYYTAGTTGLGTGNFYTCTTATTANPVADPSKWSVVEIPAMFRGYLVQAGYADWLTSDGQAEKAQAAEAQAWQYIELEADKLQRQSGQARRLNWVR